jgi:MoaA/NifB/PqqE/SkfB family radical SAM enzyme
VDAGVDIEPTNRCNAKCHFCPRDQTPHQGLMSPEVFEQTLRRTVELRAVLADTLNIPLTRVSLCGLGEPLLNRQVAEWTGMISEAGFECVMSSNAALLDEKRGRALLDNGLSRIMINVGDRDDQYEEVYQLSFEKTLANVLRFAEMAGDRCEVHIVLVDHRQDPEHLANMREFWSGYGIKRFMEFDIMNRGGALFVDHMQYESYPERTEARDLLSARGEMPVCAVPFLGPFVGYDGQYYLCCSDWKKEVPLGSVFDRSFVGILRDKWAHVLTRRPICATCNIDPLNKLTDELRSINAGESDPARRDALTESLFDGHSMLSGLLEQLDPGITGAAPPDERRRIPVTSL